MRFDIPTKRHQKIHTAKLLRLKGTFDAVWLVISAEGAVVRGTYFVWNPMTTRKMMIVMMTL
jgi:hypothetical protein